jgi:hypothetical protein
MEVRLSRFPPARRAPLTGLPPRVPPCAPRTTPGCTSERAYVHSPDASVLDLALGPSPWGDNKIR